jgi:hypothetical protein
VTSRPPVPLAACLGTIEGARRTRTRLEEVVSRLAEPQPAARPELLALREELRNVEYAVSVLVAIVRERIGALSHREGAPADG